jgi:hypothetical protein
MHDEFKTRWLDRFGLPSTNWQAKVRVKMRNLPFADTITFQDLFRVLFVDTPRLLKDFNDSTTMLIAEAFGWCCFSIWQCGSAFPSFPENYALFLKEALFAAPKKRPVEAEMLSRMLVEFNAGNGQCGFNKLALANPETIRDSEKRIHDGSYEFYLKAQAKYDEYLFYLKESKAFKTEWKLIKASFPKQTNTPKIIHRTLLVERNWERGTGAQFKTQAQRFLATFDLFCWKYFLWGMERDKPHLMKPSVVFTPLGTQIFIPGYLSLDAKRDLNFAAINQIHKARGVLRQGDGFSVGRHVRTNQMKKAIILNKKAQNLGLKGNDRYRFISRSLRMSDCGDYRNIRSLLETKK